MLSFSKIYIKIYYAGMCKLFNYAFMIDDKVNKYLNKYLKYYVQTTKHNLVQPTVVFLYFEIKY